ncbi:MAG: hypothetical protein ABGZ17_08190, partial [Planctomycetaceae bacterium]
MPLASRLMNSLTSVLGAPRSRQVAWTRRYSGLPTGGSGTSCDSFRHALRNRTAFDWRFDNVFISDIVVVTGIVFFVPGRTAKKIIR